MKPHTLRKTLSLVNVALCLGVLGIAGWFFSDVLPATGQVANRSARPRSPELARWEQTYEGQRQTGLAWLPAAPVSDADLHAYILRRDYARKDPAHWIFSGPMPPIHDASGDTASKPVPGPLGLESLGEVALLVYGVPRKPLMLFTFLAAGESGARTTGVFGLREWVRVDGHAERTYKLTRIIRTDVRHFEIHYEVFGADKGKAVQSGVLRHFAGPRGPWPPYLSPTDVVASGEATVPSTAPAAGSAAGMDGEALVQTAADAGVAGEGAADMVVVRRAGVGASGDELRPVVVVNPKNRRERAVRFDRKTYEFFHGPKAKRVAASIKTEVVVNRETGRPLGLRITGLKQGSAATALQVRKGDILLSINGHALSSRAEVIRLIERLSEEKLVTIVLERHGKQLTYHVDPSNPKTRRQAFVFENLK